MISRISKWIFGQQRQESMVVCRVGFGFILFCSYLWRVPYVDFFFGPTGMGGFYFHQNHPQVGDVTIPVLKPFYFLHLIENPNIIYVLYLSILLCSLAFMVGFRTRLTGSIALLLHCLFVARAPFAFWSWSYMIRPFMLYVVLSQAGSFSSVDSLIRKKRTGHASPTPGMGTGWPLRLMQVHLVAMYFHNSIGRFELQGWADGAMVFGAMNSNLFSRFPTFPWSEFMPILKLINYFALILEPLAVLMWFKRIGPWIALALFAMHFNLELLNHVGWWNVMMCCALTSFMPAKWLRWKWKEGPPLPDLS